MDGIVAVTGLPSGSILAGPTYRYRYRTATVYRLRKQVDLHCIFNLVAPQYQIATEFEQPSSSSSLAEQQYESGENPFRRINILYR